MIEESKYLNYCHINVTEKKEHIIEVQKEGKNHWRRVAQDSLMAELEICVRFGLAEGKERKFHKRSYRDQKEHSTSGDEVFAFAQKK